MGRGAHGGLRTRGAIGASPALAAWQRGRVWARSRSSPRKDLVGQRRSLRPSPSRAIEAEPLTRNLTGVTLLVSEVRVGSMERSNPSPPRARPIYAQVLITALPTGCCVLSVASCGQERMGRLLEMACG